MTAYILLIYLEVGQNEPDLLVEARLIVEWLNEQRNRHGGFTSTQVFISNMKMCVTLLLLMYASII